MALKTEPEAPSAETRGKMLGLLDYIYSRLTDTDALAVIYWFREALEGAELTIKSGTPSADEEGLALA